MVSSPASLSRLPSTVEGLEVKTRIRDKFAFKYFCLEFMAFYILINLFVFAFKYLSTHPDITPLVISSAKIENEGAVGGPAVESCVRSSAEPLHAHRRVRLLHQDSEACHLFPPPRVTHPFVKSSACL